ncbi:MAG: hypothetical protein KDC95_10225 [Planctomycetes bacterium]|nr:hypothetical protein [Planctomycetota bacterium]
MSPILVRTEALRIERRRFPDRRQRDTRMVSRYTFFGGRREGGRRTGETTNVFVDRFGQGVFLLATAILLLNALDAFFTLLFLGLGGQELNPVALQLLEMGPLVFLGVKTLGIGLATLYLVVVSKFRGVIWGFWSVVAIYSALLVWHLMLYSRI